MSNRPYSIVTEVTCDLPQSYYTQHAVIAIPLVYTMDNVTYDGSVPEPTPAEFYEKMRHGILAKTSANSPSYVAHYFERELQKGNDVLYLGFSSGLSCNYQNSLLARDELSERYPDASIICIDTLTASLGQGLLVDYVVRQKEAGASLEEAAEAANKVAPHVCHYFTVDDLNHLHRGGRVSKTTAIFGTMLGIKPVMHVDNAGHLIPHGKVRGRRQSLDSLVSSMGEKLTPEYPNPYIFISHGDCEADAKYLADQIDAKYGIPCALTNTIGQVIGTHSGPGTIAIFFLGSDRSEKKL